MNLANITKILREVPGKGYLVQLEGNQRVVVNPGWLTLAERKAFIPPPRTEGKKTNIGDPMPHGSRGSKQQFTRKAR